MTIIQARALSRYRYSDLLQGANLKDGIKISNFHFDVYYTN